MIKEKEIITEDLDFDNPVVIAEKEEIDKIPSLYSPEWNEFIMGEFTIDELDPEGYPKVTGLRRLVPLYVGEIIENVADMIQCPTFNNTGRLTPAVAKHRLVIKFHGQDTNGIYQEVADVHDFNCDAKYAVFGSAVAATRAEARNYRKLLQLKCIASEEKGSNPKAQLAEENNEFITDEKRNVINAFCKELNINAKSIVDKYVKLDKFSLCKITEADKVIRELRVWRQDKNKINPDMVGYDKSWQKSVWYKG